MTRKTQLRLTQATYRKVANHLENHIQKFQALTFNQALKEIPKDIEEIEGISHVSLNRIAKEIGLKFKADSNRSGASLAEIYWKKVKGLEHDVKVLEHNIQKLFKVLQTNLDPELKYEDIPSEG